jgi:hypothetical protein
LTAFTNRDNHPTQISNMTAVLLQTMITAPSRDGINAKTLRLGKNDIFKVSEA